MQIEQRDLWTNASLLYGNNGFDVPADTALQPLAEQTYRAWTESAGATADIIMYVRYNREGESTIEIEYPKKK